MSIQKVVGGVFGIELGFKADDYRREVSRKLIEKKKNNPDFWTKGKPEQWNWDNCRFTLIPIGDNKVRIVIRRRKFC